MPFYCSKSLATPFFRIERAQIKLNDISKQFYSHSLEKCKHRALIN